DRQAVPDDPGTAASRMTEPGLSPSCGAATPAIPRTRAFHEVAQALSGAGIPAMLMRDAPETLETLDEADVLVPPHLLDKAVTTLHGTGWELMDTGRFHPLKRAVVRLAEG